jgi:hypothetical protein
MKKSNNNKKNNFSSFQSVGGKFDEILECEKFVGERKRANKRKTENQVKVSERERERRGRKATKGTLMLFLDFLN